MAELDAEKIAADAAAEADAADAAAKAGSGTQTKEDNFSDDDLDPEKIESGFKSKTLNLDNAGILKRFKKVHGKYKELGKWRSETEPKLKGYETQAQAVQRLLSGMAKFRSKDKPNEPSFLENLIGEVMEENGKPDWKGAHSAIARLIEEQEKRETRTGQPMDPAVQKLQEELEALKAEGTTAKEAQKQAALNQEVTKAFAGFPAYLAKKEIKGLPWKDKEFVKQFEQEVEDKILAWSSRNEEKLNAGILPPFNDIAESVAKLFLAGGSHTLQRQVLGGDKKKFGLTRSQGPGGAPQRKLPKKGDDQSEADYILSLANSVEEELAQG